MKKTVQVVLLDNEGRVLSVSRKNDHTDMNLIGGKVDPEDMNDLHKAAYRETKEETGLEISNFRLIFAMHWGNYMSYTYLCDYSGEIHTEEPHVVRWTGFNEIISGSFGEYNKLVVDSLMDMGIKIKF